MKNKDITKIVQDMRDLMHESNSESAKTTVVFYDVRYPDQEHLVSIEIRKKQNRE